MLLRVGGRVSDDGVRPSGLRVERSWCWEESGSFVVQGIDYGFGARRALGKGCDEDLAAERSGVLHCDRADPGRESWGEQ